MQGFGHNQSHQHGQKTLQHGLDLQDRVRPHWSSYTLLFLLHLCPHLFVTSLLLTALFLLSYLIRWTSIGWLAQSKWPSPGQLSSWVCPQLLTMMFLQMCVLIISRIARGNLWEGWFLALNFWQSLALHLTLNVVWLSPGQAALSVSSIMLYLFYVWHWSSVLDRVRAPCSVFLIDHYEMVAGL